MSSPETSRSKATAHPGLWPVLGIGLFCRLGVLFLWFWIDHLEYGDVLYYWDRTYHLAERGLENSLIEYPTPVVWLLNIPQILSGGDRPAYSAWFVLMMVVFDLALCFGLWRSGGPHRGAAITFWSIFQLFLGTLVWLRFDMVPAALVGLAALFASRHPGVSGAFLGLGAAVKLWPAALLSLFVHKVSRWLALGGFAITFGGLVLISIAQAGTERLISPLTWQTDRGLQIESVWATPLMIQRASDPQTFPVEMSQYQAFEVFGPGREEALQVASTATLIGVLACAVVVLLHWLSGRPTQVTISTTMLMAISMIILTNKTFSPQYVVWLAGPLAVLIARVGLKNSDADPPDPSSEDDRPVSPATVRRWTIEVLAVALLSQIVYPTFYVFLWTNSTDHTGVMIGTTALAVRNAVVVLFTLDVTITSMRILWQRRKAIEALKPDAAGSGVATASGS